MIEQAVLDAAQAGDSGAMNQLMIELRPRIMGAALRLTKNHADAEDLAQDVLLRMHERLGEFRGEAQLSTWLHSITRNQFLTHLRKAKVRRAIECARSLDEPIRARSSHDEELTLLDTLSRPPEQSNVALRIDLDRAISALHPKQQFLLQQHMVAGHTSQAVSAVTGIPVGTIKADRYRLRTKMMRRLTRRPLTPAIPPATKTGDGAQRRSVTSL